MSEAVWGLHHPGTVDFVADKTIAISWEGIGDVSGLPDDRQPFRDLVDQTWPGMKPGRVANSAGQLYRFVHEMQPGDLVVYPNKLMKTVQIGRVAGPYSYDQSAPTFRHRRTVEWLKTDLPRPSFTQGALYEIGSALTLFRIKNHDNEFRDVLASQLPPMPTDPAVEEVAEDQPDAQRITDFTRDHIVKAFSSELKGHPFAAFVAHLLNAMGYVTQLSPPGADGGVDIVASRDPLGLEPPVIKVQCKSSAGKSGAPEVQSLLGTLGSDERGLFVALGGFSPQATHVARTSPSMRLLDADQLIDLLLDHYDHLAEEARGLLPLRRVWVPDRPSGTGE